MTGARWHAQDARSAEGRSEIIRDSRTWFSAAPEPVGVIAALSNRRESPFWRLCRDVVQGLEPDGVGPWYSRFAWANVYPVGPDQPPGSPWGPLKEAQDPFVGELLRAMLEMLDARRVVVISGPTYWWHPGRAASFVQRPEAHEFPLLRAGRTGGRSIVVGYHPTYARRRAVGAVAYSKRVIEEIERLGRP